MSQGDRHLFRKQLSGASKRKAAKEKDERLSTELKKTKCIFVPSLTPLTTPSVSEAGCLSQSATANVNDDETVLQHNMRESDEIVNETI
jgi:hypothetical protein